MRVVSKNTCIKYNLAFRIDVPHFRWYQQLFAAMWLLYSFSYSLKALFSCSNIAFVFIILFVNTCCQAWRERERERFNGFSSCYLLYGREVYRRSIFNFSWERADSMDLVHATYFMGGGKSIERSNFNFSWNFT